MDEERTRIVNLAREYTEIAIETLAEITMFGESERGRVAAANSLLDRGWGRAPQSIDLQGDLPVRVTFQIGDAPGE